MANKKSDSGLIYIKKNETGNERAPLMKGFVSIPLELAALLAGMEPDSYGNVKLDVALWRQEDKPGVLKGSAQLPYKKEEAPVNRKPKSAVNDETDF